MLVGYVLLQPMCGALMSVTVVAQCALGIWFFAGSPSYDAAGPLSLAVTIFAAPIATIFGAVPGVAWLIRRGRLTLRNLLILGAAVGNIPIATLMVLVLLEQLRNGTLRSGGPLQLLGAPLMGAWFGVWSALFFWFVSIRGTELDVPRRTYLSGASKRCVLPPSSTLHPPPSI
ncbi:MAG TPA: hypothetical protein VM165_12710, partial [Planctomycetaceae bacterium]|nr:hypothetical protein [Planctomycetaceae bacterium]